MITIVIILRYPRIFFKCFRRHKLDNLLLNKLFKIYLKDVIVKIILLFLRIPLMYLCTNRSMYKWHNNHDTNIKVEFKDYIILS